MTDSNANTTPAQAADDPTGQSDISYYRQSAAAKRLAGEALDRSRKARREAIVLLPLAAAVIVLYRYLDDQIGNDEAIRIAAAIVLAAIGWRFARDIGRALGPRLLSRFDPGTASTVGFFARLITLVVMLIVAFRLVGVNPRALALGGALTVVIIGVAAQSTLGNLIAGAVLLMTRPFRIGERVRLQGSTLGGQPEGTVASIGLLYTTIARGEQTLLVPNNGVLTSTIVPLHEPAGIDMRARLKPGTKPSDLQKLLDQKVHTPTRDRPHIALEEVYGDGAVVRITATPVVAVDGDRLADEMLEAVAGVAAPG